MKRIICALLALISLLGLCACGKGPTMDPVLAQRRDAAESYMRSMLTVLWTPEEDILYCLADKVAPEDAPEDKQMLLRSDRIYQGMPYGFAGSTLAAFMEYAGEADESGVRTVSALPAKSLSGSSKFARIGIDGSSAVMLAWSQIGCSFSITSSENMTTERGYLPVGSYTTDSQSIKSSNKICQYNGQQVMNASYAQLQKADALVSSLDTGGHTMMVVDVHVVSDKDGNINSEESYVTTLAQFKDQFLKEAHFFNEQLGQEVYPIGYIDSTYTFRQLYDTGYLPLTCKELIDPAPVTEAWVKDSNVSSKIETLLNGTVDSNYNIDTITITISDTQNNPVQQAVLRAVRYSNRSIQLNRFTKDGPEKTRGSISTNSLPTGDYRCTVVCRLVNGQEFTTRDFQFETQ